jgi:hypothetical protein
MGNDVMLQYARCHWVHSECGLKKWGAAFFGRLALWQLKLIPFLYLEQYRLLEAYETECRKREKV